MDSSAIALAKRPQLMTALRGCTRPTCGATSRDPELRAKLTPHYRAGCKRILISDNFYQAVAEPEDRSDHRRHRAGHPDGIVTVDGTERPVDAIVLRDRLPRHRLVHLRRHQGRRRRRPGGPLEPRRRAWRTAASPSPTCPNLFFLLGPEHRAGPQLGGVHDRVADPLRRRGDRRRRQDGRRRWRRPAPRRIAFNDELQHDLSTTVWNTGGCRSWYLDEHGVNRSLWSRHDLGVLAGDAQASSRRSTSSPAIGADTRTHDVVFPERCRTPGVVSEAVEPTPAHEMGFW